jgi:alkylhydroperoxidase family enzyme
MARISYMEYDDAPKETQQLYDRVKNPNLGVANIYKVVGNHPQALHGLITMSQATYRSGRIEPQLAELAYLYTSTLNQCHY